MPDNEELRAAVPGKSAIYVLRCTATFSCSQKKCEPRGTCVFQSVFERQSITYRVRDAQMTDDLQLASQSGLPQVPSAASASMPKASMAKRPPKYRNSDKPEETWCGIGKRPNWLKAQLNAGHRLEEFRILE